MNENKAPKLDPKKIIQAIAVLEQSESVQDIAILSMSSYTGDTYSKTKLYSLFLRIRENMKKSGTYKFVKPFVELLSKFVPSKYKNVQILSLSSLLNHEGTRFVENVYESILKRTPDDDGVSYYTTQMMNGSVSKIDVIGIVMSSKEAKNKNIKIKGYKIKYISRKIVRGINKIPLVGYIFQIIIRILLLPKTIKNLYSENMYLRQQNTHLWNHHENFVKEYEIILNAAKELLVRQISDTGFKLENKIDYLKDRLNTVQGIPIEIDDSVYLDFENRFRGTREMIKDRLMSYSCFIDKLKLIPNAFVLDIGCGRGEWLEVMRDSNINAEGVDLNKAMVSFNQNNNFNVAYGDCIKYLEEVKSELYDAITGFQLIEHLPFNNMFLLFKLSLNALKQGGFVLFETPNNNNLLVSSSSFYSDPTHVNKLTPETLKFYLEQAGFRQVEIIQQYARKNPEYTGQPDVDEVIYKINMEQDCTIVGYK